MKKLFCFLLCLSLFLSLASADAVFTVQNGSVTRFEGTDTEITVPSEIDGSPVLSLGQGAFSSKKEITSLTLSSPLAVLYPNSMGFMKALTSLTLPDSLVIMGNSCLQNCPALTELTIPANVSFIGPGALSWCQGLQTIRFEGMAPAIGIKCFDLVPSSCVYLVPQDQVDAYRAVLPEGADIRGELPPAPPQNFTPEDAAFTITDDGIITGVDWDRPRLDIPETIGGIPVRGIGDRLFEDRKDLYMVRLPEGVEAIGRRAFAYCSSLWYISLPSTLKTIHEEAFTFYFAVSIQLPEGLETVENGAFSASSLSSLTLPSTLRNIGEKAFSGSGITELSIPAGIQNIGAEAFSCSYLKSLRFEGMVPPQMDPAAFKNAPIERVEIPETASREQAEPFQAYFDAASISVHVRRPQNPQVSEAGKEAVYEGDTMTAYTGSKSRIRPADSFEDVLITRLGDGALRDNTVVKYFAVPHTDAFTTIGSYAFAGSVLEHVDLFDSVTSIGEGAFQNCEGLKELTLPASLTSIGANAFDGLTGLTELTILCDPALLPDSAFASSTQLANIVCPGTDSAGLSRLFASQEAPAEPETTAVPESGQNPYIGTWYLVSMLDNGKEIDPTALGMSIVFSVLEGGTYTMDAPWGLEEGPWTLESGKLVIESEGVQSTMEIIDGRLSGEGLFFSQTPPEAPAAPAVPSADEEITISSVAEANGVYDIAYLKVDDMTFSAEDLISMEFFNDPSETVITIADGQLTGAGVQETLVLQDGHLTDASTHSIVIALYADGSMTMTADNVIFGCTPRKEESTGEEWPYWPEIPASPVPAPEEAAAYIGTWHCLYMETGGFTGDPRQKYGDLPMVLSADGTTDDDQMWFWDETSGHAWYGQYGAEIPSPLVLEGDLLIMGNKYSGQAFYSKDPNAVYVPEPEPATVPPEPEPMPTPLPEAPAAPAEASGPIQLDVLYKLTRAVSGGYELSPEALGNEYSVRFNSDGTVDFTISGQALPMLTWRAEDDHILVDYYNASTLDFSMVGDELHVFFMETMEYYYKP